MITIKQIRGVSDYLGAHLSANDYYSEGEEITGHWWGKLAKMLGLEGREVISEDFESLRDNLHPSTGEKLRPRAARVKFHDVVISAPKSYSIVALVGGDERLVEGFEKAAMKAFERLERFAAARERGGAAYHTEKEIRTGNGVAAVFRHDASRLLDPQLHTHLVFSNHTFSSGRGEYLALQPKTMMDEAKRWITDQFHRDLARVAVDAGYRVELKGNRMRLADVSLRLEYKFSRRTQRRRKFERRYRKLFGREPGKKRVEQFIKEGKGAAHSRFRDEYRAEFGKDPSKELVAEFVQDWRSSKMARSTGAKVKAGQRQMLGKLDAERLDGMVQHARSESRRHLQKTGQGQESQEEALESIRGREGEVAEKVGQSRKGRTRKDENHRRAVGRIEAIRRMRRGMAVARALQGYPAVFMIQQLSTLARSRNEIA